MPNIYKEILQQELIENFPQLNTYTNINNIIQILSEYNISIIPKCTDCSTDIQEKMKLFIIGKRLEGLSESTLEGYELELSTFSKHINKMIDDITTNDIRLYLGKFGYLKISTLSRKISVLKSFFGWLRSEEIISKDVTEKIKTPKKEKRLPKALNIEEIEIIREACVTLREHCCLEMYYATGARLSELHNTNRFTDINWQSMTIRVIGKGNKERNVYFGYKALHYLKKYIASRTDDDPALFVTERKPIRKLCTKGIQREIKIIAKRSGITKNLHIHVLRHSMATTMLDKGCDLSTIQRILGHSTVQTTENYCQVTDEHVNQGYKKFFAQ